ncbi:MAG TPA: aminoacyl-tRNA hydrolase [Vicinamibacteria bacterium]|nr:aminoacyl-tRNA hydrolase [Vicinamibacteria bacterium]
MRFVVGLGNPSERYRRTRHNVGFMVVDALVARAGVGKGHEEALAQVAGARLFGEEPLLLVKPLTFMNRSGAAVDRLLADHAGGPQDLLVVVDDVALELGRLRVRERGSHGGHNGLRSIIEALGSEEFARVRVGIRKGDVAGDLAEYVLDAFPPEDVLVVREAVERAADAVECVLREGTVVAMNRFNGAAPA